MRIFGLEIGRAKALNPVPHRGGWRTIFEPFTGAWQRNLEEKHGTILCYPALYACLSRISQDIGTMPFLLKRRETSDIWIEVENTAYSPVLRKPNKFQNDQQFREAWVLSLLIHGNTYILKQRDNRGVVTDMYVMDPCRVMPMVADNGDVYYQINYPSAQNLLPENYPAEQLTIPASEIIHHRINCFHHQLIGVPPLCAAHWPAVKNLKILKNSTEFFANGARPGGILTAPAGMSEEDGKAIQEAWQTQYGEGGQGKVALIGADLKYQDLGLSSGADSQLVAQLEYSDRQICQPFGVPPYIVGVGEVPAGMKVDEVTTAYYQRALSPIVEGMERLLDEGMDIPMPLGVELDEDALLRMDFGKLAEVETNLVGGKIKTPDEARAKFGLMPTGGGDTLWGQQQDYPLGMLADRSSWDTDMQGSAPDGVDQDAAAEQGSIQQEALNGAQVTALQGIIFAVSAGQIDPSTARALIQVAFPLVSDEQIDAMLANAQSLVPANDSDVGDEVREFLSVIMKGLEAA